MDISVVWAGTHWRRFFHVRPQHSTDGFPHPYMTYEDLVQDVIRRLDCEDGGGEHKVWSSLDGPFCGGREPTEEEKMQLRRQSRSHATERRFNYPSYVLFILRNTYGDKIEVFFSPKPDVCALVLMTGLRPSAATDDGEKAVRKRLLDLVLTDLDADIVRAINVDTW